MKILILGGTGHIGSWLVPALVERGHTVSVVSREKRAPYRDDAAWQAVTKIPLDRGEEEKRGTFSAKIAALNADVVVDLICFRLESARALAEALRGCVAHFLHCGTIWIYGVTEVAPIPDDFPRRPLCDYGRQKLAIEEYLLGEARRGNLPATLIHPGHISGPGWTPINPQGNLNLKVFEALAKGEEVLLPNDGLSMLHHVHAADVAQLFLRAIENWNASVGEAFHAVSPGALTLSGYAHAVARWFGRDANIRCLPWNEWKLRVDARDAEITFDHARHSPCASIEKARLRLGYTPRTSTETLREALAWLIANGKVEAPKLV